MILGKQPYLYREKYNENKYAGYYDLEQSINPLISLPIFNPIDFIDGFINRHQWSSFSHVFSDDCKDTFPILVIHILTPNFNCISLRHVSRS